MPTAKKPSATRTKKTTKSKPATVAQKVQGRGLFVKRLFTTASARWQDLLKRRPHRSFQRTYRRDYTRSLNLPGYWAFTNSVRKVLWDNKKTFLWLMAVYALLTISVVNLSSE